MAPAKSRQTRQDDRQTGQDVALAVIKTDVGYIKDEVRSLNAKLDLNYVQKTEFAGLASRVDLIFKGFFFLIGIITVAIMGAVFRVIFR